LTIPTMTNCPHPGEGWCLECVRELEAGFERYASAIRRHRDYRGDDRCWQDDEELYRVLPEGYTPPKRDTTVELTNCERYIRCRHNPGTEYVSPQREIERLKALVESLTARVAAQSELLTRNAEGR
jgi:hypothetical protein